MNESVRSCVLSIHEFLFGGGETEATAVTRVSNDSGADSSSPPSRPRQASDLVVPSAAGTTVQALKGALLEIVGEDTFEAGIAKVKPEVREAFEPMTSMTWVPVDVIHLVVTRVAAQANRNFDQLMDEAVQRAAEKTLRTSWRMLLRVTSDRAIMSRAPILYSKWRNVGRLKTNVIDRGKVELVLSEWPGMDTRSIRSLGITIETVMRLAGRKQIRVQSQSTPDGAKYAVAWAIDLA